MRFESNLLLAGCTMRVEKAGEEDGDLGSDMKLTGPVPLTDLAPLIGCEHTVALLEHLYDGSGTLQTANIGELKLDVEHKDCNLQVRVGKETKKFLGVKVDGIVLVPKMMRSIEFSAMCKVHPTETQLGWLGTACLRKPVRVIIEGGLATVAPGDKTQGGLELNGNDQTPPAPAEAPKKSRKSRAKGSD